MTGQIRPRFPPLEPDQRTIRRRQCLCQAPGGASATRQTQGKKGRRKKIASPEFFCLQPSALHPKYRFTETETVGSDG
jgi:hypothetical protein